MCATLSFTRSLSLRTRGRCSKAACQSSFHTAQSIPEVTNLCHELTHRSSRTEDLSREFLDTARFLATFLIKKSLFWAVSGWYPLEASFFSFFDFLFLDLLNLIFFDFF